MPSPPSPPSPPQPPSRDKRHSRTQFRSLRLMRRSINRALVSTIFRLTKSNQNRLARRNGATEGETERRSNSPCLCRAFISYSAVWSNVLCVCCWLVSTLASIYSFVSVGRSAKRRFDAKWVTEAFLASIKRLNFQPNAEREERGRRRLAAHLHISLIWFTFLFSSFSLASCHILARADSGRETHTRFDLANKWTQHDALKALAARCLYFASREIMINDCMARPRNCTAAEWIWLSDIDSQQEEEEATPLNAIDQIENRENYLCIFETSLISNEFSTDRQGRSRNANRQPKDNSVDSGDFQTNARLFFSFSSPTASFSRRIFVATLVTCRGHLVAIA